MPPYTRAVQTEKQTKTRIICLGPIVDEKRKMPALYNTVFSLLTVKNVFYILSIEHLSEPTKVQNIYVNRNNMMRLYIRLTLFHP